MCNNIIGTPPLTKRILQSKIEHLSVSCQLESMRRLVKLTLLLVAFMCPQLAVGNDVYFTDLVKAEFFSKRSATENFFDANAHYLTKPGVFNLTSIKLEGEILLSDKLISQGKKAEVIEKKWLITILENKAKGIKELSVNMSHGFYYLKEMHGLKDLSQKQLTCPGNMTGSGVKLHLLKSGDQQALLKESWSCGSGGCGFINTVTNDFDEDNLADSCK